MDFQPYLEFKVFKLIAANPRAPGSWGFQAWELLQDGMTVDQYLDATKDCNKEKGRRNSKHLDWDFKRGWVKLVHPRTAEELRNPPTAFRDPPDHEGEVAGGAFAASPEAAPRFWWVNHKQTHKEEVGEGFLWSPHRNRNGHKNSFYDNMRRTRLGDYVLSYYDTAVRHVGVVRSECYDAVKPFDEGDAASRWSSIGHRVEIEFVDLRRPVHPREHWAELEALQPESHGPLDRDGAGLTRYLCGISNELGLAILDLGSMPAEELVVLARPARSGSSAAQSESTLDDELDQGLDEDTTESDVSTIELRRARRGQGKFRAAVLELEPACRVTGVNDPSLLVASHMKPWRVSDPVEKLDGANGLALTPNADRLFDRGLLSFADDGRILLTDSIDTATLAALGIDPTRNVGSFSARQKKYLAYHRDCVFRGDAP